MSIRDVFCLGFKDNPDSYQVDMLSYRTFLLRFVRSLDLKEGRQLEYICYVRTELIHFHHFLLNFVRLKRKDSLP